MLLPYMGGLNLSLFWTPGGVFPNLCYLSTDFRDLSTGQQSFSFNYSGGVSRTCGGFVWFSGPEKASRKSWFTLDKCGELDYYLIRYISKLDNRLYFFAM